MTKQCAPGKKFSEGTCFSLDNLITIAENYNKNFPNNSFQIKKDKKYLLKNLTSRMKKKYDCDSQTCWINTHFIKNLKNDEISHFTFRPNGPKGKYEWLSTTDINKVMKQYEHKYKDFKFLGAVPYDFEDLSYLEPYKLNLNEMTGGGKNRIGMVINLDTHDKPGSHWVAFYSNLNKNNIYYFDSFGKKPGKRTARFIKKFYNHMTSNGRNMDIRFNKKQHQFNNSECGVYSMNFIIRSLNGETFDEITNNITKDTDMNACRNVYFRN
jgi:hypothetical protein